jgi:Uma2 family endonuclease
MSKTAIESDVRMTRDEYRNWAEHQPSRRFERVNGIVVAMAPERAQHNERKMAAWLALRSAVTRLGLPCRVYGDGMTVEVGDSDYEPDAIVYCGQKLSAEAVTVPDPLVIVEVLSPSTSSIDRAWKFKEYFRLPSLRHYLIIWADKQQIVHHSRDDAGEIHTRTVIDGEIRLDPPGVAIAINDIYAD